ncbi:hypothetical protein ABHF91_07005 [Pseudaeromonas sp. ZJS20]|uniref:hypothetical protein n=1 Tax=Pseudaeromonas aegiceratis TaxID=3153928 RepID=UPI00390C8728
MPTVRLLFISFIGGGAALLLEYLLARFISFLGIVFWFSTIIGLSILEDWGLPTLQSSSDGWPMATIFGVIVSAVAWWLFWSSVLAFILWRKYR